MEKKANLSNRTRNQYQLLPLHLLMMTGRLGLTWKNDWVWTWSELISFFRVCKISNKDKKCAPEILITGISVRVCRIFKESRKRNSRHRAGAVAEKSKLGLRWIEAIFSQFTCLWVNEGLEASDHHWEGRHSNLQVHRWGEAQGWHQSPEKSHRFLEHLVEPCSPQCSPSQVHQLFLLELFLS